MSALGLSEDIISKIIAFRAGQDGVAGTSDDNFFEMPSSIVPKVSESAHLSAAEIAQLSNITNQYLCTKSGNFLARYSVKLDNSRNICEVFSIINRNGKILYWREP